MPEHMEIKKDIQDREYPYNCIVGVESYSW